MKRWAFLLAAAVPLLVSSAGAQASEARQPPAARHTTARAPTPPARTLVHRPVPVTPEAMGPPPPVIAPAVAVRAETLGPPSPEPPPVAPSPLAPPAVPVPPPHDETAGGETAGGADPAPAAPAPAAETTAPPAPVPAAAVPGSIAILRVPSAIAPTILLRTESDVGLAAFRSGGDIVVVLDAAIDYQPPGQGLDPMFAQMSSKRTQNATVISIPLAAPGKIRLMRDRRGWLVAIGGPDTMAGIVPHLIDGAADGAYLRFALSAPSRVVTVVDPQTGGRLLVGTQGRPGEGALIARVQVQFSVLPTMQGVVVAANSDDIQLRRDPNAFSLLAGPHAGGTIISSAEPQGADVPDMAPRSQMFDIPTESTSVLSHKMDEQIVAAASAPSLARSAPRLRVAATMVGLTMGVEAQSVLDIAAIDDPGVTDSPRFIGLRALAGVLSHRLDSAETLANPRLDGTEEIELWRTMLSRAKGKLTAADAQGLAAELPLVLAYPPMLRDRLLPEVLEAMVLNGQAPAAQKALDTLPEQRDLDLMRAMALEATDHPVEALALYDDVADRSDRLQRYKSLTRAAELRLKHGDLDAKATADALDKALFGWRDPLRELPLRLRVAELRRDAGQWADALSTLRDGRAAFPDSRPQIDRQIAQTFTALFTGDAAKKISPADFVTLYDKNTDLVKEMTWPEPIGLKLVDHMIGLDLQGRAEPMLARLVARSVDPADRALMGARLATVRMTLDDPAGAIAALSDTTPPQGTKIAPAVTEARQMLYARAESGRGNKDTALTMLANIASADADDMRADIYAARKDWPHAVTALGAMAGKRIPDPQTLSADQQAIVMRLTEAATLGNDAASLARIADTYGAAMAKGPSAALFRLMTSPPVQQTADLPRAYEEIGLAGKLPARPTATARP